jgi:hypothetical protein
MNTTSGHTITLGMLLCEADIHDKKGERWEAAKIRQWVAELLCEQSKLVRSVWGRLPKPSAATLMQFAR